MFIMEVKFGKLRLHNGNSFGNAIETESAENIFAASNVNPSNNNPPKKQPESGTRINDYDSTILEKNAYQALPDELFKLEHRINTLEEALTKINNEINTIEGLNYDIQIYDLKNRKHLIEQELIELNKKYSSFDIGAKISGRIVSVISSSPDKKEGLVSTAKKIITKNVLAKFSKTVNYNQTMKEALKNLNNINTSVDELIQMQVPYGENVSRYEKLTAYLNKANLIHSTISKNINAKK